MQNAARQQEEQEQLTAMAAGMGAGMGMGNRNACSADNVATNNNSIKFNELSNCIVIIEHTPNDVAATTATPSAATRATTTTTSGTNICDGNTTIGSAATYAGFGYYSVAGAGQEGGECANIRSTAETDALSTCSSSNSNTNNNSNTHCTSSSSNNYKSNNIDCCTSNELEQLLCGTVEPVEQHLRNSDAACQLSEFVSFEYVRKYLTDAFDSPVKSEVPSTQLESQLDNNFEHYDMQFI